MKKAHLSYLEGVKSGRIIAGSGAEDKAPRKTITSGPSHADALLEGSTGTGAGVATEEDEEVVELLDAAVKESLRSSKASTAAAESSLTASRSALTALEALQRCVAALSTSQAQSKEVSGAVAAALKASEGAVQAAEKTRVAVRSSADATRGVAASLDAFLIASAEVSRGGDVDGGAGDSRSSNDQGTGKVHGKGRLVADDDANVGCVPSIGISGAAVKAIPAHQAHQTNQHVGKHSKRKGKHPQHQAKKPVGPPGGAIKTSGNSQAVDSVSIIELQPQEVYTLCLY